MTHFVVRPRLIEAAPFLLHRLRPMLFLPRNFPALRRGMTTNVRGVWTD